MLVWVAYLSEVLISLAKEMADKNKSRADAKKVKLRVPRKLVASDALLS